MASVGFRWLDILEKEFDKAFVDLDLAIGKSSVGSLIHSFPFRVPAFVFVYVHISIIHRFQFVYSDTLPKNALTFI